MTGSHTQQMPRKPLPDQQDYSHPADTEILYVSDLFATCLEVNTLDPLLKKREPSHLPAT